MLSYVFLCIFPSKARRPRLKARATTGSFEEGRYGGEEETSEEDVDSEEKIETTKLIRVSLPRRNQVLVIK